MDRPPEPDDLLALHQAGDPDAFDRLVEEMAPRLKGFFLRQGAEASIAEDLAQNVFVRVLQSLHRYRPSGQVEAYMLRIARNLWIDQYRRQGRVIGGRFDGDAPDDRAGPEAQAQAHDRAALVQRALRELEPEARELLELAVLQRLPYKDVAEILGVPVGTVKSRVFYALRRLRERLAAFGEEA